MVNLTEKENCLRIELDEEGFTELNGYINKKETFRLNDDFASLFALETAEKTYNETIGTPDWNPAIGEILWRNLRKDQLDSYSEIVFTLPHRDILWELLEQEICNSSMELLPESDYGKVNALTSAPIICFDVERDDKGELLSVGNTYWYPDYAIKSELEELLKNGFVEFDKA